MRILLQERDTNKVLAEGEMDVGGGGVSDWKVPRLRAGGSYWLRIYLSVDEREAPTWEPVSRDDVAVLTLTRNNASEAWEPPAPPGCRLLLRVHFQVDNDGPAARIIRLGFRDSPGDGEYRTWRLQFTVGARKRNQAVIVLLFAAGFWLSELFELYTTMNSGRSPENAVEWLSWSFLAFVACIGLSTLALKLYEGLTT